MAPANPPDQSFSFEIVSCLLASLLKSNVIVGAQHFALMEKIDASTTKSGYEHRFRAVKARAKEINEQIAKGEIDVEATPVKPKPRGGGKAATPASSKRKSRFEMEAAGYGSSAHRQDDEEDKTPTKKAKFVKKEDERDADDFF